MSNFETTRSAREAAEASLNTATDADRSTLEASAMAARNAEVSAAAEQQAAQEQAAQEQAAQERAAQERAAQERAAQERAAQERAAQEKTYQEKAAADRLAQERAKTEKVTKEKAAEQKAAQAKWGTYSEKFVTKGVALWGNTRHIITEHKPTPKTDEARAANRAAEAAKARALQARNERQKQVQADALKQRKVEQRQGMIDGMHGRKGVTPERVSAINREMQAQEKTKQAASVPQNLAQSPDKSAQLSQIDAERQAMREQINEGKTQQQGKASTAKDFAQKLVAEMKAKQPQQGQPGPQKGNSRRNEQGAGM